MTLRQVTGEDLADLRALDADPEVMRYLGTDGTASDTLVGAADHWTAVKKENGEFLGWFGLAALPGDPDVRELGYRIKRGAWGNGYATEGARSPWSTRRSRIWVRGEWWLSRWP